MDFLSPLKKKGLMIIPVMLFLPLSPQYEVMAWAFQGTAAKTFTYTSQVYPSLSEYFLLLISP